MGGRYRLVEQIGAGGMGSVHRAFDEVIGEHVALKMLLTTDEARVDRCKKEVVLARRVTHKNIARTFDIGLDGGMPFITMELVEGESLRQRLGREPPAPGEVAAILAQVAAGLAGAHTASVIHQDLKPANILLGKGGRVVIIDFGVAVPADPRATDSEELVGTYDYMAPEQIRGAAPRPASDVYALGIIGFEMLMGRPPFDGATPMERALARLHDRAPSLLGVATLPGPLAEVVERCLDPVPVSRPSATEIAATLEPLAAQLSTRAGRDDAEHEEIATVAAGMRHRTIRVLSFTSEGQAPLAWDVGAGLSDELADLLSRTKGIDVITSASPSEREGRCSSSDLIVQGSVRGSDRALVITARLIEDRSGEQLWSGRFEGPVGELLAIGGQLAASITEALRLELEVLEHRGEIADLAIEHYLRARQILRSPRRRVSEAIDLLDRCLALSPSFAAAVAARAVAVARAHQFADRDAGDVTNEAVRAVDRALLEASELPDTQIALGILSLHQRRFDAAARAFERAIEIAPTHAIALEQLGRLEVEGGQWARGQERLRFASRLDPLRPSCFYPIARSFALRGNLEAFDRTMAQSKGIDGRVAFEEVVLSSRVASWTGDVARARAARRALAEIDPETALYPLVGLRCDFAAGDDVDVALRALTETSLLRPVSTRLTTVIHQATCELYARRDPAYALSHLRGAVALSLIDIEWLELCPALDPLREASFFQEARARVRERIQTMWSGRGR